MSHNITLEKPPTSRYSSSDILIRDYVRGNRDQTAFHAINSDWIIEHFRMEPHDEEVLGEPEKFILDIGGFILLAVIDDVIVGTVALVPLSNKPLCANEKIISPDLQGYELAKMGVAKSYRSKGVGRALGEAIMRRAAEIGAPCVHIWSNRKLPPAIILYETLGFVEVPLENNAVFERANIRMLCDGKRLALYKTPTRQHSRYSVDPIAQKLVWGLSGQADPSGADTYGVNANLYSVELSNELKSAYNKLKETMEIELRGCGKPYVYPWQHIHITAASPTPFTHCTLSLEERARFETAFLEAVVDECVPSKGFPDTPFPIIFGESIRLDKICGIFLCGDPTGSVDKIRACLRACMTHPSVLALGPDVIARAAFKHPGIVHSSFVRFLGDPESTISDDDIAERFQRAVQKSWSPVTIYADALQIVREVRCYMHLFIGPPEGPPGPDAHQVLKVVSYGSSK